MGVGVMGVSSMKKCALGNLQKMEKFGGVGNLVICPNFKSEKFNVFSDIHFFSTELVGTELVGTELVGTELTRHRKDRT